MKECYTCKKEKSLDEFHFSKKSVDLRTPTCKLCSAHKYLKVINCFFYIVTNPAWDGFVKMGRSRYSELRLKTYQTASPFRDYKLVYSLYVHNATKLERNLKAKYGDKYGEWYKLSVECAKFEIESFESDISNHKNH